MNKKHFPAFSSMNAIHQLDSIFHAFLLAHNTLYSIFLFLFSFLCGTFASGYLQSSIFQAHCKAWLKVLKNNSSKNVRKVKEKRRIRMENVDDMKSN